MAEQTYTALVTGASSGIGLAFCQRLAGRCDRIIAVARREDRLLALREELADEVELIPVQADLATVEGVTVLSPEAPLALALAGREEGDEVEFRGQSWAVEQVG